MKNLSEIIANFKELNQHFFSKFCSIEKCAHCPYTGVHSGRCLAGEFNDLESDLINIRASLSKLLVGQEGEEDDNTI